MQNMVWRYCKRISPEWKLQVSGLVSPCPRRVPPPPPPFHLFTHPPRPLSIVSSQMEQKMTASDIFKDKKDNYPQSVPKLFVGTRLSKSQRSLLCSTVVTATTKKGPTSSFLLLRW